MASPANDDSAVLSPILFKSPGLKPDVRLKVFNQGFHVHSVVLKLHSAYFRKFLDSPEKPQASATAQFKYDYISVVDDDCNWGLEPTSMGDLGVLKGNLDESAELEAFRKLLCAMYNRPYTIDGYHEFTSLFRLADFYCALPVLSFSLDKALHESPPFVRSIELSFYVLLPYAKKLRNALLFRECLVHVAPVGFPVLKMWFSTDQELVRIVRQAYHGLCELIMCANFEILRFISFSAAARNMMSPIQLDFGSELDNATCSTNTAFYYRRVLSRVESGDGSVPWRSQLVVALRELLCNRLVFDAKKAVAGEGAMKYRFLSAQIAGEDLPWDLEEIDWRIRPFHYSSLTKEWLNASHLVCLAVGLTPEALGRSSYS